MMKVVNGHKAIVDLHTEVRGYEVHSSLMHQGVSAVMVAARLIAWVEAQNADNIMGSIDAAEEDQAYEPPWTTLHVGQIAGGTAGNITARDCWFGIDIRCLPSEDIDDWIARYREFAAGVEAEIRTVRPEAAITVGIRSQVPGCRAEPDGIAETLARKLTGDNSINVVSYATEAGQFQDEGFSSVICGPGSIEQAHQANEFLSRDQLNRGSRFISDLIRDCSA